MLVNRTKFILVTFTMMILLSIIIKNTYIAGLITFNVVVIGYIIIAYKRSKKRISIMEDQCDPEKFIDATEAQRKITGKNPKVNAYLNIDKGAGLILMGEFQKAKELLLSIDKTKLSPKNGSLLSYMINLICCHYELGEIEEGEALFENQIPILSPINPRLKESVELLIAERLFFLKRFDESKEKLESILEKGVSKRKRLGILYILAEINEVFGETESARKKYSEIAEMGNKLWISKQARHKI